MSIPCERCGAAVEPAALCAACREAESREKAAAAMEPEFDHRGIRLPARTRVGGIIIPQ